MEINYIIKRLPETPPEGLVEWAEETRADEFGLPFCSWKSERVRIGPDLDELMYYQSTKGRSVWVADCRCGACYEDFYTAKVPGEEAILLTVGEDGSYYTAELDGNLDPECTEIQHEGDEFYCPFCGSKVELIHRKALRGGRKQQIMVATVQVVEGYLAIFYWMVWRTIDEWGVSTYGADPKDCYVLDEKGVLVKFTHMRHGFYGGLTKLRKWEHREKVKDGCDDIYSDWRSIQNKKVGVFLHPQMPSLVGTTGEKTGLREFLDADGWPIIDYLKLWRHARGVENLCKTGQVALVRDIVRTAWRMSYDVKAEADKYIDRKKQKPHEMLGISRADYRLLRNGKMEITITRLEQWRRYTRYSGQQTFVEFLASADRFGTGFVNALDIMQEHPGTDLPKLERYMEKQKMDPWQIYLLRDTRKALRKLYGGRVLTAEELWPKNLHRMHEETTQLLAQMAKEKQTKKLQKGFDQILSNYGHLQWNDGDLCVVLPKSNNDLIREGNVLRHCVGMYGNDHIAGDSVIFFIRHYRRPERPYYTLAISMTRGAMESQLHGYGNEKHGPNKEYSHSIPAKVRKFCDRWENEILQPWYRAQEQKAMEVSA